jgi:hypothetical protein
VDYGLWRPGSAGFSRDARQVILCEFVLRRGERFAYEYNFTAGWRHDIKVEEILPRSPRRCYPACTAGARQAPPEHFGRPEEFLALRQRWPPVLIAVRMAEIISDLMDADPDALARRPSVTSVKLPREYYARLAESDYSKESAIKRIRYYPDI